MKVLFPFPFIMNEDVCCTTSTRSKSDITTTTTVTTKDVVVDVPVADQDNNDNDERFFDYYNSDSSLPFQLKYKKEKLKKKRIDDNNKYETMNPFNVTKEYNNDGTNNLNKKEYEDSDDTDSDDDESTLCIVTVNLKELLAHPSKYYNDDDDSDDDSVDSDSDDENDDSDHFDDDDNVYTDFLAKNGDYHDEDEQLQVVVEATVVEVVVDKKRNGIRNHNVLMNWGKNRKHSILRRPSQFKNNNNNSKTKINKNNSSHHGSTTTDDMEGSYNQKDDDDNENADPIDLSYLQQYHFIVPTTTTIETSKRSSVLQEQQQPQAMLTHKECRRIQRISHSLSRCIFYLTCCSDTNKRCHSI